MSKSAWAVWKENENLRKENVMKILAVIPARGGSKGIPNKNIRLLGDHPLIYYAINNAMNSKYITDIVVTTDSEEVGIIAKQMGVSIKKREPKLAEDHVTLDAVIYDAAKEYDADYVITMQPTSPTLKIETLDAAIDYCITNKLDTVISAINAPRLAWKVVDGQKVPAYERRLNRQYLPPYYLETGAFVIAKKDVVSENTRIGRKVDVFEISENEAIDIDTFIDLKSAELILNNKKIAMYVNGNNSRGAGHVYRALELADEFYSKPDIYYDVNQTDVRIFGDTTHNLIGVNGIAELFEKVKEKRYTLFVNDILTTTIDYMIALRNCNPNAKIINFEDDGEGILRADLVINALYENSEISHMYVGEKYYIAPKIFMLYPPIVVNDKVNKVLIAFGGADPQNYTERLLSIISKSKYQDFQFEVILGKAKKNVDELLEKYRDFSNIHISHDVRNMPKIMSECDIAVTSRGRTGYELAMLGIPTIAMAQNRREEKHEFVSNENGFTYIGLDPSDYIIESTLDMYINMSREDRQSRQDTLLQHDLRNGRNRVMSLIESL